MVGVVGVGVARRFPPRLRGPVLSPRHALRALCAFLTMLIIWFFEGFDYFGGWGEAPVEKFLLRKSQGQEIG